METTAALSVGLSVCEGTTYAYSLCEGTSAALSVGHSVCEGKIAAFSLGLSV